MADLTLPAGVELVSMDLGVEWPGLQKHENPFSGKSTYLERAHGRYVGTATFALTDRHDQATGALTAMLITALRGGVKTVDLPLNLPTVRDTGAQIAAVLPAERFLLDEALQGAPGDYLAIAGRLKQIRTIQTTGNPARSTIAAEPYFPHPVGAAVRPAATIEVRQRDIQPIIAPRDPSFWGPWVLPFEEVIP